MQHDHAQGCPRRIAGDEGLVPGQLGAGLMHRIDDSLAPAWPRIECCSAPAELFDRGGDCLDALEHGPIQHLVGEFDIEFALQREHDVHAGM